ncbi:MAG: sensor histidine kinase [bacterium]
MKTKIFFAFLVVIFIALISNVIFHFLMKRDFEKYVKSTHDDQLYWVMAAIEGSYEKGRWDVPELSDALHWGMMLGFDIQVADRAGKPVMQSSDVIRRLSHGMHERMQSLIDLSSRQGVFEEYPLYTAGQEIGLLRVREIQRRGNVSEKENIFKRRGREFMVISFLIAGGGAVLLAFLFITYLTRPLLSVKKATEEIAHGNFGIMIPVASRDEIGQLARAFNFMSEALKREDAIRKHLTSNIAHELRTPLAIIKANLEGVADGVIECSREQVAHLKEEVDRLTQLVEGIEDITRAEASFLKPGTPEEIDLNSFLEKQIVSLKPIAEDREIEIIIENRGQGRVRTDPQKLQTIVKNLLSNALKFTRSGTVSLEYGVDTERFYITIADTGRGMQREETEHIFDRFYKADDSAGTGVGLAIVKELVEILGGEIQVRSEPGKGSRFKITLPMHRSTE